jgi:hypothetical protein
VLGKELVMQVPPVVEANPEPLFLHLPVRGFCGNPATISVRSVSRREDDFEVRVLVAGV